MALISEIAATNRWSNPLNTKSYKYKNVRSNDTSIAAAIIEICNLKSLSDETVERRQSRVYKKRSLNTITKGVSLPLIAAFQLLHLVQNLM